jgi:exopolysaccharide biosynthesis polyprenyl glycosylphosphotransferase
MGRHLAIIRRGANNIDKPDVGEPDERHLPKEPPGDHPDHSSTTVTGVSPSTRRDEVLPRKPHRPTFTAALVLLFSDLVCMCLPGLWDQSQIRGIDTAAVLTCFLFWSGDLYRPCLQATFLDELPALLGRLLAVVGIIATASALRHPSSSVTMYLKSAAVAIALTLAGRCLIFFGIRYLHRRGLSQHKTLIVGTGLAATRLAATLAESPAYGLSVVGYIADHSERDAAPIARYLGQVHSLWSQIEELSIDIILIADSGFAESELTTIVQQAIWVDCTILMVPRLYQAGLRAVQSDMIGAIPLIRFNPDRRRGIPWKIKRLFDVSVSLVALILLFPVFAVCALAVRLDSGPTVFFRQIRVGRDGKPFKIIKFRTMTPSNEEEQNTNWSITGDSRVTTIGRFLRRTSLDELPQFWNILRGDMTIVGPRPERPYFVERFSVEEPSYVLRHRVPSGLTGLAQVNGMRGNTSISERSHYDNHYIENWSLWLDIKVILRTFAQVLSGGGGR